MAKRSRFVRGSVPRLACWVANGTALLALALLAAGCRGPKPADPNPALGAAARRSDAEQVHKADVSILFVGNSHTGMHDLPGLVCKMIRFRQPQKTAYSHYVPVAFLEDAARTPTCRDEIESRPWTHVILQAQKISASGKHNYSREEGLGLARLAKARGAAVVFYPEWGLKGFASDGARQEKIYREMARDAGVAVAPVARAWDLALAQRPALPLHDSDGNHQSPLGAFLTACVLVGRLTGDSPAALAAYPYPAAGEEDRRLLAGVAAKAISEEP